MIDGSAVDLARLQFAITGMYHFIFVPLTLGLVWILVIMESVYVITGKEIYKEMTKFWGKLFGINFALGVTTGITMEFQFGTNWAYYSHYVGDIFGAPLAIEGLMAFFLESTMIGLFFFGWNRLSKGKHLLVTILLALGSNLSAVLILIANGWMQDPLGAHFNPITMRMELNSFADIVFNPMAQEKFVHTVSAGYVTGSMFVLGISGWYLLKGKYIDFAKRSFCVAAAFGIASAFSVVILGDESGYSVTQSQKSKLAALEGMWESEEAPAGFTLFAIPDEEAETNHYEIRIPYVLGIITTRSFDTKLPGIKDIRAQNEQRITSGIQAVLALNILKDKTRTAEHDAAMQQLQAHQADLGYGLLVHQYVEKVEDATPAIIKQAAHNSVPKVAPLFWSFRVMVALGFLFIFMFIYAFRLSIKDTMQEKRWFLKVCLYSIPLPWIAIMCGWFLAEYGRQPWTVFGVLPTYLSPSSVGAGSVLASLIGFIVFYTGLLIAEMYLMFKYARLGPVVLTEPVK
ncbi:cytochrome ubiquinol oxidase subunit I [Entomomonas sp. E2T0]|uniref:cytochrome ubiquinol oxidase subunit I n=1 Tax=Entomomonas sp. E2T0 TaxID=2930213 RepID=UPI0022281D87|nr:cytochrome ubiquinol oxidase subunit I [Entomomonas sp. E2T0]UYZ83453.1 cytochrome ubiquinol oxidase subunit I [Entomomonas sp. E2T0]